MNEDKIFERLNNVESALAHLQKDFDALNDSILVYAKQFEKIHGLLDQMSEQIRDSKLAEPSADPLDEKPPHY